MVTYFWYDADGVFYFIDRNTSLLNVKDVRKYR